MKELSLNILDIAQNSISAEAKNIGIVIDDVGGVRTLTITDDGRGMSQEFVDSVTNPFTTTRKTRPVGLGLPFLKLAAEQADGKLTIRSKQGEGHGTSVKATFRLGHIDCVPLGDIAGTIVALIQCNPDIDFTYEYKNDEGEKKLSTKEMRENLGDLPLNEPEVLMWVSEFINEPLVH